MAESVREKYEKRVIFPSGRQNAFLLDAVNKSKLSYSSLADKLGVHKRTFNDWRRERYSLPFSIFEKISAVTKLKRPQNIEIRGPFWYINQGAKAGGFAVFRKYGRIGGDPEYRRKKWYEWWEKEGKYKCKFFIGSSKPVKKPNPSKDLAEFTGIMIGDGGITEGQVRIWLNPQTDKPYIIFVQHLIKELFDVEPTVHPKKNQSVVEILISRTSLVTFCRSIGLRVGNKLKQGLDIPEWIKKNLSFKIACLRGLIDTDGCIFYECHHINQKRYCYPRLAFSSASKPLLNSVFRILQDLGFSPKIRRNKRVQVESKEEIIRYFKLVGTSNQKHIQRFSMFGGVG